MHPQTYADLRDLFLDLLCRLAVILRVMFFVTFGSPIVVIYCGDMLGFKFESVYVAGVLTLFALFGVSLFFLLAFGLCDAMHRHFRHRAYQYPVVKA